MALGTKLIGYMLAPGTKLRGYKSWCNTWHNPGLKPGTNLALGSLIQNIHLLPRMQPPQAERIQQNVNLILKVLHLDTQSSPKGSYRSLVLLLVGHKEIPLFFLLGFDL